MPEKIAVLIPGIMGSALYYERSPLNYEIWGENIMKNYRLLCQQPRSLEWTGSPANSRLMKTIQASGILSWKKSTIYEKLSLHASAFSTNGQVVESSYDWRDSVLSSCNTIVGQVERELNFKLGSPPTSDRRIIFLAHSLGGLALKAAIARDLIHPAHVDRIVFIGSPLAGSPAAFRSMYSEVDLPFFSEFSSLFRGLDKEQFRQNLLTSFRSFPSLSQLLPTEDIDYILYSPLSRSNPLRESYMLEDQRRWALEAQEAFRRADLTLQAAKVPTFAIYTSASSAVKTDFEYVVRAMAVPSGYELVDIYRKDWSGDGTVPEYSAKGADYYRRLPVVNCNHAFMCDARPVLDAVTVAVSGLAAAGKGMR